jgi:hypothetical protein
MSELGTQGRGAGGGADTYGMHAYRVCAYVIERWDGVQRPAPERRRTRTSTGTFECRGSWCARGIQRTVDMDGQIHPVYRQSCRVFVLSGVSAQRTTLGFDPEDVSTTPQGRSFSLHPLTLLTR